VQAFGRGAPRAVLRRYCGLSDRSSTPEVESDRRVEAVEFRLREFTPLRPQFVRNPFESLCRSHQSDVRHVGGDPLVAAVDGKRGNPVCFGARWFDDLRSVDGDVGGRHLLREASTTALVETGDPGVRRDIDRPGDRP
jgi:hypothetical protein